jgi:SnoaL-like domain
MYQTVGRRLLSVKFTTERNGAQDMANETRVRAVVERASEFAGADVERAEELYNADAVLEFPQTGERFVGRDTFTEWRSQHPVSLDDIQFRVVRVTARDDFAAVEILISWDRGATWKHGVSLLDFAGDKISHERIYVVESSPAPEWRAKWRSA